MSPENLEVLEKRRDIIERNSKEISKAWKIIPLLLYFVSAIAGYGCSILFYILWQDTFGHNCPIWATLEPPIHFRYLRDVNSETIEEEGPEIMTDDWRRKLMITFKHDFHCQFFFFMTLCSCLFGVIWLILFSKCGKGGYDTRTFTAPWRIVPPALIFHLIFVPIVITVVHDLVYGYWYFTKNLKRVAKMYMNETEIAQYTKHCEIVKYYLAVYDINTYDICAVYAAIKGLSWIMAWSWILSLGVLILRVITANDFRLLITTIYKIPPGSTALPKRAKASDPNDKDVESSIKKQGN